MKSGIYYKNRLSELGINSVIALSRVRRMRAVPRAPFEGYERLLARASVVGQYLIENKKARTRD